MAKPFRPNPIFVQRNGNRELSPQYKSYLSYQIRMTADERSAWKNLGVHITGQKEKKLVGFWDAVYFLEAPIGRGA